MKRNRQILAAILLLVFSFCAVVPAGGSGHKETKKTGILLVAFGSSLPEAQVSFENIDKKVRAAYPDIPIRWAYTSSIIRKKLAKRPKLRVNYSLYARVAELADALDLGSSTFRRGGSSPPSRTTP